MQARRACSSWPAGILLWLLYCLLFPVLIPTTFLCANGMSFQRSLSFLNDCQIRFWSWESETSRMVSGSIWFGWCWYSFFPVSMYMKKKRGLFRLIHVFTTLPALFLLTSGLWKRIRRQASERKMSLKEARNYSWVFLVIKEFPCVLGILNLDHVFSPLWKVGVTQGK